MNNVPVVPLTKAAPAAVPIAATVNASPVLAGSTPATPPAWVMAFLYAVTSALVIAAFTNLTISSRPTSAWLITCLRKLSPIVAMPTGIAAVLLFANVSILVVTSAMINSP